MAEDTGTTVKFTLPQDKDIEVEIDVTELPESVKNRLLKTAAKNYVLNSTSTANDKWKKAGSKEDDAPDFAEIATAAKTRLMEDKMRSLEGGKSKAKADPIEAIVKAAVLRDLFTKMQKKNPKAKWTDAVKKIGPSALEYLRIQAGDDAEKVKAMNEKYIKPAQKMMGLDAKGKPIAKADDEDDGDDLL